MIEGKISIKDRLRLGWEKMKLYPKIWVSSLAILCLLLGFIGGMGVGSYNSRTPISPHKGMRPGGQPAFPDEGNQKMTPPDDARPQNDNQDPSSNSDHESSNESGFETQTN